MSAGQPSQGDAFTPAGFALNVALAVSIVGFGLTAHENRSRPQPPPPPPPGARSNIHRDDYVGPAACAECHSEKHEAWREHPHSRMNLDASPATVRGDFSGVELRYAGRVARFTREGQRFFMTVTSGTGPQAQRRRYRVTRTVGSRFTQMYIGVLVEGPEAPGDPAYAREGKLPFGYWFSRQGWFPESYFDSDCPPEYDPEGQLSLPPEEAHQTGWEQNCLYCHNTYAYDERLRAQAGTPGFPAEDLKLLPTAPKDPHPDLAPDELVTLGISCESCHFGGRDHAQKGKPIHFLPESPYLEFKKATPERIRDARQDPYVVNSICAQCHFSRGVSLYPNGAGIWNSREAVDMQEGACATQLRCTDCHDPHRAGPPGGGPPERAHLESCTTCHAALKDRATREDHTQHGDQVSCLDCHMPRIVQGLESVVRTHRISSPGDPKMLRAGAPNACNLCHLDRSISWTVATLKIGWGQRHAVDEAWSEGYRGRLDAPVGPLWLGSPVPINRLVAADAYARSPLAKQELPRLIRALVDPMAVNRMFALFALERALGRKLTAKEYEPTASPRAREEQVRALLASLPE